MNMKLLSTYDMFLCAIPPAYTPKLAIGIVILTIVHYE